MILFIIFIIILSFFELRGMWEKNQKREMIVYAVLACITLISGSFYFPNAYRLSFVQIIFHALGISQ